MVLLAGEHFFIVIMKKKPSIPGVQTDIDPASIVRIEGRGNYSILLLADGTRHLFAYTLTVYTNALPHFIRCHKSHLINPDFIAEMVRVTSKISYLILHDNTRIPISRRRLVTILEQLK